MDVQNHIGLAVVDVASLGRALVQGRVDERSTPVTRMLNSLPWNSLGVLMSWFSLMLPPAGAMAPMMSANAPPKISAMTSSVMSRICHQRIFFFFFRFRPCRCRPFCRTFCPLPCAGHRPHRAGLAAAAIAACGGAGLWAGAAGASACLARRGCAAASSSRMPPTGLRHQGPPAAGGLRLGRAGGLLHLPRGRRAAHTAGRRPAGALLPGSGGRFTVRRGRCT